MQIACRGHPQTYEYNTKQKTLVLFGYLDIHVTYTHPSISW